MKEVFRNVVTVTVPLCRLYMSAEEKIQYLSNVEIKQAKEFAIERIKNAKNGNHSKACILQF